MLVELHVRQFALVESLHLQFQEGMTVFTGETGAGKSILVDALGAVFGARAKKDWIRHGAEQAEISAVLEGVEELARKVMPDVDADEGFILKRVIFADGRSRAYVNGLPVPLRDVRELGKSLLDIFGQHEHQTLLSREFARTMLDLALPRSLIDEVKKAYRALLEAEKELASFEELCRQSEREEAWLRDEYMRLKSIGLQPGLEASLREAIDHARHHVTLKEAAAKALSLLEEGPFNVRDLLGELERTLSQASPYRTSFARLVEMVQQMDAMAGEIALPLRGLLDEEVDQEHLAHLEERLHQLLQAKRRHRCDEEGLRCLMEKMASRIETLETSAWERQRLLKRLDECKTAYQKAASQLSAARKAKGKAITEVLRPYLDRLALDGMRLQIAVEAHEDQRNAWTTQGWDEVTLLVSSNPGEPFRPLKEVASGGELSRLALALKGCGLMRCGARIAVFDEADVGIGGETAWSVGALLHAMGRERQVLVVSHLPQVAACANHHIHIRKGEKQGRMQIEAELLDEEARQKEIARMLGGESETSLAHARRMIDRAGALCKSHAT